VLILYPRSLTGIVVGVFRLSGFVSAFTCVLFLQTNNADEAHKVLWRGPYNESDLSVAFHLPPI
jgi:hypothetical protein